MWKQYCIPLIVAMLTLTACGPNHPVRSVGAPSPVAASNTPEEALASQQLADAMKLVADKNWPEASQSLQRIIERKSFSRLSSDLQHKVLIAASEIALFHGSPERAYEYFVRATSFPNATFADWSGRLNAAYKANNQAGSISTLTVLVQRWPDRNIQIRPEYILNVIDEAKRSSPDSALPLLQGLYDAHWKLKWGIEPSDAWCDLILRLVESGRLAQAIDVSAHVTDVDVLIGMRSDRRFDAVVAANAAHFDIDAASTQAFQTFQAAAENSPKSLELQIDVMEALLRQQRYEAALAASDSVLFDIRSTNYPANLYTDYDEYYNWLLDERADLLERVGRWDEAVAQLTAASKLSEEHGGNVSQLINVGGLYCDLERPREALEAIGRITGKVSPFGMMQLETVRLIAAYQLEDSMQVARSLQFLGEHRADAPGAYEEALISANELDRAANLLLERLRDKDQRTRALKNVQTYAAPLRTPRRVEYYARWRTVLARQDVQAAIRQVGRIEQYKLEGR
jgi:tetratricopeptide (TPR) repeat protein